MREEDCSNVTESAESTQVEADEVQPPESFSPYELNEGVLSAIARAGWTKPTPVQAQCLPHTLKGKHLAGFAQTGTGKTGVFLITMGQNLLSQDQAVQTRPNHPRAIVLVPTRELAMQICHDAEELFLPSQLRFLAVFGGVPYEKQQQALEKGVDVIVATPGRLKDYYQKKLVMLDDCSIMVCDEADRMFDMGFIDDAEFFLSKLPEDVQKLLFSATTNDSVKELAFEYLENPEYISANPESITPESITQQLIVCESYNKVKVMLGLFAQEKPVRAIIFTNTKMVAEWLHYKVTKNGYNADIITGDLPQKKRIALIKKIKAGDIRFLVATDVASRGLHISGVTHVFNFDIPDDPSNYVHRIGRTARAGAEGKSISLICEDYGENMEAVKELLGPSMDLKSEWYDPEFIKIEDKSGNPYDDPSFRGSNEYKDQRREEAEQARTSRKTSHERQKASSDGDGEESKERPGRKRQKSRGGRDARQGAEGREDGRSQQPKQGKRKRKKPHHEKGPSSQKSGRPSVKEPTTAKKSEHQSITGVIKSIFSTFFGKKK